MLCGHHIFLNPDWRVKPCSMFIIWNLDLAVNDVHWTLSLTTRFLRTPEFPPSLIEYIIPNWRSEIHKWGYFTLLIIVHFCHLLCSLRLKVPFDQIYPIWEFHLSVNIFDWHNFLLVLVEISQYYKLDFVPYVQHIIPREMDILHKENWTRAVTSSLKKFEKSLIIALKVTTVIIINMIIILSILILISSSSTEPSSSS